MGENEGTAPLTLTLQLALGLDLDILWRVWPLLPRPIRVILSEFWDGMRRTHARTVRLERLRDRGVIPDGRVVIARCKQLIDRGSGSLPSVIEELQKTPGSVLAFTYSTQQGGKFLS